MINKNEYNFARRYAVAQNVVTVFNTIVCMSSTTPKVSSYNLQQHFPDSSSCTRLNLAGPSRNAAQLPATGYGSSSTSITSRSTVLNVSMLNVVVARAITLHAQNYYAML